MTLTYLSDGIAVSGPLTRHAAAPLADALRRVLYAPGSRLVVDLQQVEQLELMALQVLLSALRSARSVGKPLILRNPSPRVREELRLCGALPHFQVEPQ